jgi:hypothetical protein
MIISHKHRYLFIELPHTGSTAIGRELCENYDGESIFRKHAYYHEFLEIASTEEKTFFVFSCIRNPLDEAVTVYFRYKTNHHGSYTNPKKWRKNGGHITEAELRKYRFIKDTNADFPAYFQRFFKRPYSNWSILSHKEFDFVIRFERLQDDFAKALKLIGIEPKRPLPVVNRTDGRRRDFLTYYTPDIYQRARHVMGPLMQEWGYDFPREWGDDSVPQSSLAAFRVLWAVKKFYWRHLKWGSSLGARLFRRLYFSDSPERVDMGSRFK